ncbi:MAG: hypothetical protein M1839_002058 [Geoglossum umbratile]|nr:MAG: hypothetical protein M1839_002058 [Geoglossum umbratile]
MQEARNKLSRDDRNAVGALQVSSKAFEVWFMFVAAGLVYDVTMFMAERKGKFIPIGFLTTYLEFGDLRYFCTSSPWTTPFQPRPTSRWGKNWGSTLILYGFLFFVISMSVTANLMGPGSAVLMIPVLQYRNTTFKDGPVLKELAMGEQPSDISISDNCNSSRFLAGDYRCLSNWYGRTLDGLLTGALASYIQAPVDLWPISSGLSQEGLVSLLFNVTCSVVNHEYDCGLFSSPNRQILRSMSADSEKFLRDSFAGELEPSLNNSLQTVIHRMGPSIAQNVSCFLSNTSVATITEDRTVRCYGMLDANFCVPVGRGWQYDNNNSNFSLENLNETIGNTVVNIYSSEVAVNQSWAHGGCAAKDESCWNSGFTAKHDTINNVTITEFRNRGVSADSVLFCLGWFYPSHSHYELDPTVANDINLVRITSSYQDTAAPQGVHPDWFLAGWSTARGRTVTSRAAGVAADAVSHVYETQGGGGGGAIAIDYFGFLQRIVFAQAMSLVSFTTTPKDSRAERNNPKPFTLDSWAVVYVYAYGIETRTAIMGAFVVSVGIACALLRTVTAIIRRERTKSAFELLAAALKHQYDGEFDGMQKEVQMARVRVRVDRPRYRGTKGMGFKFEREDGSEGPLGGTGWGDPGYYGVMGTGSEQNVYPLTASPELMRTGGESAGHLGRP